ncbi:MAG: hypothetical protein NTY76_06180 [Candidatus Omnitrophica bacterium]|nr:hypothetical protein [Candidatus Omnitrophota bacterium]
MLILAKLIGTVIIVMGTAIAISEKVFIDMMNFWKKGNNIYAAGAIRLIFGALFISIAHACRFPKVISVLGILMIIGGVIIFIIGPKKISAIFEWFQKSPPIIMRLAGLLAIAIGALIVYSI